MEDRLASGCSRLYPPSPPCSAPRNLAIAAAFRRFSRLPPHHVMPWRPACVAEQRGWVRISRKLRPSISCFLLRSSGIAAFATGMGQRAGREGKCNSVHGQAPFASICQ